MSNEQPKLAPRTETLIRLGSAEAQVTDDFDNALTTIIGHATMIQGDSEDPLAVAHAKAILQAARAASQLCDRVRDLLRPKSTRARVQVDLGAVVEEAMATLRERGARRRVQVSSGLGACPPVEGNPGDLLQAVLNLGHNAVDASPHGATVLVTVGLSNDGHARLVVRDEGPGIPEEHIDRVFEPFFTTRGRRGIGMGLPLARAIVDAHAGELTLTRGERGGTVATVILPLATSETPAPRRPTPLAIKGIANEVTVLVLGDDPRMRDALSSLLDAGGLSSTTADTISEALRMFMSRPPEVLVVDIQEQVDELTGLVTHLRSIDRRVPVIMLAAEPTELEDDARILADVVLKKPTATTRLMAEARRLATLRREAADDPKS